MRGRARRHALGQHYLADSRVVEAMIGYAGIRPGDHVLEIGTGRGALTKELVRLGAEVEGYEVDRESYSQLRRQMGGSSISLHNVDVFETDPRFDVLVSSLPYSESSRFVEWLSWRRYKRAVVLLQTDFATKITAAPGSPEYRAISVISQASSEVEILSSVSRLSFDPPPRVNSCLVRMTCKRALTSEQTSMVKRIFSQKRRTVRAALKNLGLSTPSSAPPRAASLALQCRVNSLRPESVLAMVGVLARAGRPGRKGAPR